VVCRLNEHFKKNTGKYKIKKGDLERDYQKYCLGLSKYSEMKQNWIKYTIIDTEMFDSLMENTKYVCSNEILWTKVYKNKPEITCKFI
jgi:hypothetical protein